jgi:hypothetical protein
MALLIQGIGTAFVGQRDFLPDGSYISTEWVVILCLPIIPLRSMRLRNTGYSYRVFYWEERYVARRTRIRLKQVLCTYAFTVFYISFQMATFLLCVERLPKIFDHEVGLQGFITFVAVLCVPFLLPLSLRRSARRRARERSVARS